MGQNSLKEHEIKNMAELLRKGHTLTEMGCPECSSPLFKLKSGEIWCAKCKKKVIILKEGENQTKIINKLIMEDMENTLIIKIQELQKKIKLEKDPTDLENLGKALSSFLENLEKLKRLEN